MDFWRPNLIVNHIFSYIHVVPQNFEGVLNSDNESLM